jgi:Uma2 family endonuclease
MSTSSSTGSFADFDSVRPFTLVELAERFGDIPANRICMSPPPGQATEEDVLYYDDHEDRLFELVDGTLIEKTMGSYESRIAGKIFGFLFIYMQAHPLGDLFPGDGQLKLRNKRIRIPDVSFVTNERIKNSDFKQARIASLSPNLAVEVISESNSQKEMDDKLQEYFATGSEEVWYVYPTPRELHQFTSPADPIVHREDGTVTTRLLPGFELNVKEIF